VRALRRLDQKRSWPARTFGGADVAFSLAIAAVVLAIGIILGALARDLIRPLDRLWPAKQ